MGVPTKEMSGLKGEFRRLVEAIKSLSTSPSTPGPQPSASSSSVVLAPDQPIPNQFVSSLIGTPIELLNANTGGSGNNRIFTVPAGKVWQLLSFRVTYVASATVGNRGLRVTYETSGGVVLQSVRAGATQTAGQTREYSFAAGAPYETAFGGVNNGGDFLLVPLPPLLLKAGQIIRLRDPANISASDTFTINGLAIEWSV